MILVTKLQLLPPSLLLFQHKSQKNRNRGKLLLQAAITFNFSPVTIISSYELPNVFIMKLVWLVMPLVQRMKEKD
jgi:nitrate reductase assembly molybdenum cofactor insertion protein NarJ